MTTQYLQLEGGKIAFDDQGDGPLILCMPAGGDMRSEYRFLTPKLVTAGYRVVTMDMRGQGESSKTWSDYSPSALGSDMLALLRHLDAQQATIIGTSVATTAAIWASVEAPDLINGLVLISAYGRAASRLSATLMANIFLAPMWGRSAYIAYFPRLYPFARPADFDTYLQAVNTMLKEPGSMDALRAIFASSYRDWDDRIAHVSVPVMVIMGSRDPDFRNPELEGRLLAERLITTRTTLTMIEGAGHHPQAEMPDKTAGVILDFLGKKQNQPRSREALR